MLASAVTVDLPCVKACWLPLIQGRRELGNIKGGGGCTGFLPNFWRNFDQLSEDLILTNQCHFKAIFSGEGKKGRGRGGGSKPIQ